MRAVISALLLFATPAFAVPLLLVGNKGEDTVSLVDLETGRELRRLQTGKAPHEIALSPDGRTAAVVSYGGTSVDLFDLARRERVGTVELGANARPHGLVWLRDGRLVATAEGRKSLMVVAPDRRTVREIPTGQDGTHMVAVTTDGRRAYTANMSSGTISVIDLSRGAKLRDVPAGGQPEGIALSPDGRRLWVADRRGATLRVFEAASMRVLATMPTGRTPIRVLLSPDGRTAVTSNYGDGTLSLFDTRTMKPTRTIPVSGRGPSQQVTILFAPDGRRLYVAETGTDRVAEVDMASGKVLRRLPAGRQGDGLAISP